MVEAYLFRSSKPNAFQVQISTLLNMTAYHFCKGCGRKTVTTRKRKVFCSTECQGRITQWTRAQVRFHVLRAGSVKAFCEVMRLSYPGFYKHIHPIDVDRLHNGMMVSIGGILCRRCPECEVARELESFGTLNNNRSGVGRECAVCRTAKKVA